MIRTYLVGTLLTVAATSPAAAQTSTHNQNMAVTMTVNAGCTVSAGTLAFGAQSSFGANIDQQGDFSVVCTSTTPYTVALDAGANSASVTGRRMKKTTDAEFINYQLFTNAGRTSNWGDTNGTDTLAGTGNGTSQSLTVYGRVPPQAIGSPGNYTDTVTITVTY